MAATPYSLSTLPAILAQVVQFAHYDYESDPALPEDVAWNIAYVCSCFLAQHTALGKDGVDTEAAYVGLKVSERMPYADRLALAQTAVEIWNGVEDGAEALPG